MDVMMDFLSSRSESAIRKEIRGIRDSYHHYWDLLAELLQNSRDAVNRKRKQGEVGPFFIKMEIDSSTNSVTVFDNGIGIEEDRLYQMLAPGGGDKDGTSGTEVGEKGVGLTYAVFSGNNFRIKSKVANEAASGGKVRAAQNWLNGHEGAVRPVFEQILDESELSESAFLKVADGSDESTYSLESFTKITVGSITPTEFDTSIFSLTPNQIKALLRTRTAVGVTSRLFNSASPAEFDFYLSLKLNGQEYNEKIEATYLAAHELVKVSDRVSLSEVRDVFVAKNDTVARKRYLNSKTVYASQAMVIDGWDVNVYGVMFPENGAFRQLSSSSLKVISDAEEVSEGASLFQSGIYVGTKGMPTGMRIEPKAAGRYPAYYKRCLFFVESANLKFDLGRKSLHYRYTQRLQSAVFELFSKFEEIAPFQGGDGRASPAEGMKSKMERQKELQDEWALSKGLADLNCTSVPYQKIPNNQEAAVAALFHELLGAKVLEGYKTLKTSYGARYDVYASCTSSGGDQFDAVIEFKHNLESLIKDLQDERKTFSEINLLVAWDADQQKLKDSGFELDSISNGFFQGVTHVVTVPVAGIDPIEVILLRAYMDRRKVLN